MSFSSQKGALSALFFRNHPRRAEFGSGRADTSSDSILADAFASGSTADA